MELPIGAWRAWQVQAIPRVLVRVSPERDGRRGSVRAQNARCAPHAGVPHPLGRGDLKTQFEAYLAAADINDGAIPDDAEVRVGSRLAIFDANTHASLGFAYAHPNINGRARYAGPTRAGGLAGAVCADSEQKLPFQNSWL